MDLEEKELHRNTAANACVAGAILRLVWFVGVRTSLEDDLLRMLISWNRWAVLPVVMMSLVGGEQYRRLLLHDKRSATTKKENSEITGEKNHGR